MLALAGLTVGSADPRPAGALDLAALGRLVFVAGRVAPEIAVVDMRDERVVARVGLDHPAKQMAVSESRGELVVATLEDSAISVYDLRTLARLRRTALDHSPEHMQLDPTGEILAVGNYYEDAVTLLRLDDMSVRRVTGLSAPHNLVYIDGGRRLLVANLAADIVTVVYVAQARIEREIGIPRSDGDGPGITDIHLAADGRRAWAVRVSGSDLVEIDLVSGTARPGTRAGPLPWRVAGTSDGQRLITGNEGDGTISLLDAGNGREIARLPGGSSVSGVLPAWFDSLALVLSRESHAAHVVDLDAATSLATIALPGTPEAGVVTADGAKALVALGDGDAVAVIDAGTLGPPRIIGQVVAEPVRMTMVGGRNICD
jgi:DNA-binding beta-propeller fold protein YncE